MLMIIGGLRLLLIRSADRHTVARDKYHFSTIFNAITITVSLFARCSALQTTTTRIAAVYTLIAAICVRCNMHSIRRRAVLFKSNLSPTRNRLVLRRKPPRLLTYNNGPKPIENPSRGYRNIIVSLLAVKCTYPCAITHVTCNIIRTATSSRGQQRPRCHYNRAKSERV